MSEALITDQYPDYSLKLVESYDQKSNNPSVIATLYGVLSDYSKKTRNGRYYSEELWEKVFKSDTFREMLSTNTFFGEPDHPFDNESRLDVHIPNVSHIIRDPVIDYNTKTVKGYLDILNTPNGKIIKSLIDYGCILGVSSRGSGELINNNNELYVDPDKYVFITWDIVARPSNVKARVTTPNKAGTLTSISESISRQVEDIIKNDSQDNLKTIRYLINESKLPNKSEIIDKIDSLSGNNNLKEIVDEAYRNISNYRKRISDLENTINELTEKYNKSIDTINSLSNSSLKNRSRLSFSTTKSKSGIDISSSIHNIEGIVSTILETVNCMKDCSYDDYYEEALDLGRKVKSMKESLSSTNSELKNLSDKYSKLIRKYLSVRCNSLSIDESLVSKDLSDLYNYDPEDIDNIINSKYKNQSFISTNSNKSSEVVSESTTNTTSIAAETDMDGLVGLINIVRCGTNN